ncbi:hypothetical protein, partial [Klebsiella pneumoniae]|uniref:hypothetical protein n=1 Tax=Klebsiella pneumoniae TaxID=573 RepID=UPI0037991E5F
RILNLNTTAFTTLSVNAKYLSKLIRQKVVYHPTHLNYLQQKPDVDQSNVNLNTQLEWTSLSRIPYTRSAGTQHFSVTAGTQLFSKSDTALYQQ